jgi:L-ascorbate metabolism protein UlaG (beta-lactamase superfamily)
MNKFLLFLNLTAMVLPFAAYGQQALEKDTFKTSEGDLEIVFIGHGTLMFTFGGKVIHLDPVSEYADYSKLPKADVILITHEHRDHLDRKAIDAILTEKTRVIVAEPCGSAVKGGTVVKNGEVKVIEGVKIEAVPAYNLVHTGVRACHFTRRALETAMSLPLPTNAFMWRATVRIRRK